MNPTVARLATARTSALRYLSSLRLSDIVVLQGPPLLGAAFGLRRAGAQALLPLATLLVANVLLMAHVFTLNDWSGVTADLADPNKAAGTFAARGIERDRIGGLSAILLGASLLLFALLGPTTLALALAITALSALYSLPRFNWKARPLLNSALHLGGGVLHFLLGYSLGGAVDRSGFLIAAFFALIFAAGHLTQETRDHAGDAISGIRTNAVIFGPRRTFIASLILFTLAHALLLLLAFEGIVARALAAIVILYLLQLYWSLRTMSDGLTYASVSRLQTRYRALYAAAGVAMVASLV